MTRMKKTSKHLSAAVLAGVMAAYSGGDASASDTARDQMEQDFLATLRPAQRQAYWRLKTGFVPASKTVRAHTKPKDSTTGSPDDTAAQPCIVNESSKPDPMVDKALKDIDGLKLTQKQCKTVVANINPTPPPWLDTQLTKNGIVVALGKDFADVGYLKLAPNPESAWGPAAGGSSTGSNSGNGATLSYSDDRAANSSKLTLQAVGTIGFQFSPPPCPKDASATSGKPCQQPETDSLSGGSVFPFPGQGHTWYGEVGGYGGVNKVTSSSAAGSTGTSTTSSTPASTATSTLAPANTNTLDYTLAGGYLTFGWIDGKPVDPKRQQNG